MNIIMYELMYELMNDRREDTVCRVTPYQSVKGNITEHTHI